MIILLGLALVGAALRQWADNPSPARDVGTLLLVMWVPVIGNVIAFFARKLPWPAPRPAFAQDRPFAGHLRVQLTALAAPRPAAAPVPESEQGLCTLVVGTEGFTARLPMPLAAWLASDQTQPIELELMRPALALPRFAVATAFHVLAGEAVVGEGRVLERLEPPLRP